jgi:hypothetical protein
MIDPLLIKFIFYQVINVNSTVPCFLNYTVNNTFQQCGMQKDFLQASLISWQWITGGNFSMILAALLCAFTYIKYHKIIYPLIIGVSMLPISYFVFPQSFLNYAFIMGGIGIGVLIWYVFISQSNES